MNAPLGYWISAVLFAVLAAGVVVIPRRRVQSAWLLAACLASCAWAATTAAWLGSGGASPALPLVADGVRAGVWIVFLTGLLAMLGLSSRLRLVLNVAWIVALLLVLAIALQRDVPPLLERVVLMVELLLALAVIVLVEQVLRNSPKPALWGIKYLCLGIGLMFAFDLYLYSEAVLFDAVNADLVAARGYVVALMVPVIAFGAQRIVSVERAVVLSNRLVFFVATLGFVGAYLMLMALGGHYVRVVGGRWGEVAQAIFLMLALGGLLALLFSDTARARFRVSVQKHLQPYKYDYRHEWLRFTKTLSTVAGEAGIIETSIRAMADIVGSPGGVLWALNDERDCYVAVGYVPGKVRDASGVVANHPLLEFMRQRQWIVNLQEYAAAPGRYGELTLPSCVTERSSAWLLVPLCVGLDLVGFVILDEPPVMPTFNFEDHDLLKTVGRDVAIHISQFEASRRLAESRQFAAYHQLSAFIMHDLKNLVAQLSLVVRNAEKHRRDPRFVDDSIETIAHSVGRMTRLMAQLGNRSDFSGQVAPVAVGQVLRSVIERCARRSPTPDLEIIGPDVEVVATPDRLTSIFEHVVTNAQDAAASGGVRVTMSHDSTHVHLKIVDEGVGMDAEFLRQRLFRPFDTTKGDVGMGIGAYQTREYVRALGGTLEIQSAPGKGTVVDIRLPRSAGGG